MASTQTAVNFKKNKSVKNLKDLKDLEIMDSSMTENLQAKYEDLRDEVKDLADISVSFVKKYPLYTLAGVAAVGIITGLVLRARKS